MKGPIDLLRARVTFRDRALPEVLDLALRFVIVHARTYALVALGSLAPLLALSILAGVVIGWPMAWAVALPLSVAAQVPFTIAASRLVFEDDVRAGAVLRSALSEAPRVLFGRALATIVIALGLTALLAPGLFLAALCRFSGEVTILERAPALKAFSRAQRLASSAMTDAVLGSAAMALVFTASIAIADIAGRMFIGEILQFKPPPSLYATYGGTLPVLGLFLAVPYLATARFFLYLNVRTRTEGWDIQTRFAAIAERERVSGEETKAA